MSGMCLVACAGNEGLERSLLIGGAVAQAGGSVVILTYTPGLALRRTFFGMEVVVRHEEDAGAELSRVATLAEARQAGVVLLDDERLGDDVAGEVAEVRARVPVARYGPPLRGGDVGELAVDPYWPFGPSDEGCFGLRYLPLHPALRALRDGRPAGQVPREVGRVTIACRDDAVGRELSIHAMEALSVWRPTLQVALLSGPEMPRAQKGRLDLAIERSRHDVMLRPRPAGPVLGEFLLSDLLLVDDPECAAAAAYLGTPVVLLTTREADARHGEALAQGGGVIHLPCLSEGLLPPALFADLLWSLFADHGRRAALSEAGRRTLDGYGAERIASALFELRAS